MLFRELDFLDRPKAAADAGMDAIEFWGWGNKDVAAVKEACDKAGMPIAACSVGTRDAARNNDMARWGLLDRRHHSMLAENVHETIETIMPLGVSTFIVTAGQTLPLPRWMQHASIVDALRLVAPILEKANAMLVLEPLNPMVNHRGYYLETSYEGFDIIRQVNSPSVKLLFDIYHQQITEGNLIENIRNNADLIGHIHTADVPGRYQPGTGEIHYERVLAALDVAGYTAYTGLEFSPLDVSSAESVGEIKAIRDKISAR
jgi:hydroxypyruvate isomerase